MKFDSNSVHFVYKDGSVSDESDTSWIDPAKYDPSSDEEYDKLLAGTRIEIDWDAYDGILETISTNSGFTKSEIKEEMLREAEAFDQVIKGFGIVITLISMTCAAIGLQAKRAEALEAENELETSMPLLETKFVEFG